jgi:hypothetical protein
MMLHPPVLALLLTALLGAATLSWAAVFALRLLRHWDLASGSAAPAGAGAPHLSGGHAADRRDAGAGSGAAVDGLQRRPHAPLLVGAMCAYGSFNASVFGFPALYAKMALFFAAVLWLALHHADVWAPDYPLTRRKYACCCALLPLALADAALSSAYFTGPAARHADLLLRHRLQPRARRPGFGGRRPWTRKRRWCCWPWRWPRACCWVCWQTAGAAWPWPMQG